MQLRHWICDCGGEGCTGRGWVRRKPKRQLAPKKNTKDSIFLGLEVYDVLNNLFFGRRGHNALKYVLQSIF